MMDCAPVATDLRMEDVDLDRRRVRFPDHRAGKIDREH